MKEKAKKILVIMNERHVSYNIDGDNIRIEDEYLSSLLKDEKLKNEILVLLKPKEPEFKLELTNANLPPKPAKQPEHQVHTEPENPVEWAYKRKIKSSEQIDFSAPVAPVSFFAYALYYELCTWLHEYASYDNWIDFEMVVSHLRNENFKIDEMQVKQALRELSVKGHLHRKDMKEYSLIGDNDKLAERLRAERKAGKNFTEMTFFVPF